MSERASFSSGFSGSGTTSSMAPPDLVEPGPSTDGGGRGYGQGGDAGAESGDRGFGHGGDYGGEGSRAAKDYQGLSNAPAGTIAACAFQLDCQWAIDAIDKVKEGVQRLKDIVIKAIDAVDRILQALDGIIGKFCSFPPMKYAKDFVERMCRLARGTAEQVAVIYDHVLEALKNVLAPWEVRSAGEQIRDQLAPKCDQFAAGLELSNFKSKSSWKGEAADTFFGSMQLQHETAKQAGEQAKAFGEAVQQMGADGVDTTITFITELVGAIIGIIQAIITMAAVPAGTAIGAAEVIGLISAILAFIKVFVDAMLGIIQQSTSLGNIASNVNGGEWPPARLPA